MTSLNPQVGQELSGFGAFQMVGNDGGYNKGLATQIALKGINVSQNPDAGLSQQFDAKANDLTLRNGMIGPQRNVAETMLPPAPDYKPPVLTPARPV